MIWLRHTADILFVIGYCVIAFLKLCFLGILRYEIKEMIQKIKLLQSEMAASILSAELGDQQLPQVCKKCLMESNLHSAASFDYVLEKLKLSSVLSPFQKIQSSSLTENPQSCEIIYG